MKKALWIAAWAGCLFVNTFSLHVWDGYLLLAGILSLLGLLLFSLLKNRRWVKFLGNTSVFSLAALLASMLVHTTLEDSSKKRGALLINAVSDYQRDHGEVPHSLGDLVPAYLPEIPRTAMRLTGTEFFYTTHGDEYYLGFETAVLRGYVYDSQEGEWKHRD